MAQLVFYSSRSGNTAKFVARLGMDALRIPISADEPMPAPDQPYVLISPTYADGEGRGAVHPQIIKFLNDPARRALVLHPVLFVEGRRCTDVDEEPRTPHAFDEYGREQLHPRPEIADRATALGREVSARTADRGLFDAEESPAAHHGNGRHPGRAILSCGDRSGCEEASDQSGCEGGNSSGMGTTHMPEFLGVP